MEIRIKVDGKLEEFIERTKRNESVTGFDDIGSIGETIGRNKNEKEIFLKIIEKSFGDKIIK